MFLLILILFSAAPTLQNHAVVKRHLLYPEFTTFQITYGLSVPLILPSRSINFSWCMQNNFETPFNLSNFDITISRENTDWDHTSFYEYIIELLDGFDLDGEACLLRTICEVSEIPMHIEGDNLLEKIIHYVLTPSSSSQNYKRNDTLIGKVLVAERIGGAYGHCDETFSECIFSFVDMFTDMFLV